jgi:two-component system, NarL family, response regulator DegU
MALPTISVLLADDNRAMLTDLRDELSKEFSIAGAVDNGEEAIREVSRLDPDILVLDITMPGMNGIQVACHLRDAHARTRVLFLTIHEQSEYISAAFSAGACGYVSKRRLANDLATAIREVFAGQTFLSPSLRK